jgi:hypothetical protein
MKCELELLSQFQRVHAQSKAPHFVADSSRFKAEAVSGSANGCKKIIKTSVRHELAMINR